jgi:hypothetical protein
MASLVDKKFIGGGSNSNADFFSNEEQWIKVRYDFDADAGATGDYEVLENESASVAYVVTDFYAHVQTDVTTASDVDVDLGIGAGGTEFLSDWDAPGATADAIVGMDTATPVKLAASGKIVVGIETGAITAGVVDMYFKLKRLDSPSA